MDRPLAHALAALAVVFALNGPALADAVVTIVENNGSFDVVVNTPRDEDVPDLIVDGNVIILRFPTD